MKQVKVTQVVAFQIPDWFKKMSEAQQKKYLEEHPKSRLAKSVKKKTSSPTSIPLPKASSNKSTDAKDILIKQGSPTNFKGPKSAKDALSDNPKKERKVVALLDKLASMAADAKVKGKDAPNYDLCQVSIPGTNLFCSGNKGIPRKEMPQLKGTATEDSWAAKNLKADAKGEVSGEDAFKAFLKEKEVPITNKTVNVASLKATQSQLVGSKVAGMLQALKDNPKHAGITAPIFVSKDGYILDGHHRWAAMVGLAMADGRPEPVKMDVIEVDMDIEDLVNETNNFASKIGIAQKAGKSKENSSLDNYRGCCCN